MRGIAVVDGSSEPRWAEMPLPGDPQDGEVLCRTLQLGICGTDREILADASPLVPPGEDHLVLGHECLARVEAVGSGVANTVVGELVVPLIRRARQPSSRRIDMLPFKEYTERGIVEEHGFSGGWWIEPEDRLLKIDPAMADVAVLAEPMSVPEKACNEALILQQARMGDQAWVEQPPRVLVTGMGPIAFCSIIACLVRGWPATMYGLDAPDTQRAELARSFGATYLPADQTNFSPADVEEEGFDLVLECTGSEEVAVNTAQLLASCGVMVWLGSQRRLKPQTLEVSRMMRQGLLRNHIILGSVNAAPRDFNQAIEHLQKLRETHLEALCDVMTDHVAVDDALWHFVNHSPQGIKAVVRYN